MGNIAKRIMAGAIVALLLPVWEQSLQAETLTLTTYYPAPYGAYKKIVTTDNTMLARDMGRVGIGTADPKTKLDVNGLIKIGSDTVTPCVTALTGALRYNSDAAIKAVEYCDGTNWRRIDAATGWITIDPGSTYYQDSGVSYGDTIAWVRWSDKQDHSPTTMCQKAGYTNYAGPCRTTTSRGSVEGNVGYAYEPGKNLFFTCIWGVGGSLLFNDIMGGMHANSATKILCTK